MKRLAYQPSFDVLESRDLLAPLVQVTVLAQKPMEMMPGSTNKVVADVTLKTINRTFVNPTDMLFLPAFGSEPLANNGSFTLWADMNGNFKKDGCETLLSGVQADYDTGLLDFSIDRPSLWVRQSAALRVQVKTDFYPFLTGPKFGVELVEATFNDFRGQLVPEANVHYIGANPTLHNLRDALLGVQQTSMPHEASAEYGAQDTVLLQFYTYAHNATLTSVTFMAARGTLQNATNYRLKHFDWQGTKDVSIAGSVVKQRLTFAVGNNFVQGGDWQVVGDIAQTPLTQALQLSFATGSRAALGADTRTGKPLKGLRVNGLGEGQVHMLQVVQYGTAYSLMSNIGITSATDETTPPAQTVSGSQTVIGAVYSFTAVTGDYSITEVGISMSPNASSVVQYATLWDGDTLVGSALYSYARHRFFFAGLNISVDEGSAKKLTVKLTLGKPLPWTVNAKLTLTWFRATDINEGTTIGQITNNSGNDIIVTGALG